MNIEICSETMTAVVMTALIIGACLIASMAFHFCSENRRIDVLEATNAMTHGYIQQLTNYHIIWIKQNDNKH